MSAKNIYGNTGLTSREIEIVDLVADGLTNPEVGERLGVSTQVVKNYLRIIYDKAGVWNRLELALWWEVRRATS